MQQRQANSQATLGCVMITSLLVITFMLGTCFGMGLDVVNNWLS